MLLLSSADFFKITFFKNSFSNTIRVSNSLDPNQDRQSVGPDLGPNHLSKEMIAVANMSRTNGII